MHAFEALPEGFHKIFSVDLQSDKKAAFLVNGLSLLIGAVMVLIGHFFVPVFTLFDYLLSIGSKASWLLFGAAMLLVILYIVLHELVHAAAMKYYGCKKVGFGFTGLYAFASSKGTYFDKKSYVVIAMAPVVVWGVVLAVLCPLVPQNFFWVAYFIQINNISGAAGDLYVSYKFSKMPKDILILDYGVGMDVFSAE